MNRLLNPLFKTVPRQDRHILTLAVASSTLFVERGPPGSLLPSWRRGHLVGRKTLFERVGRPLLVGSLCPNACMGVKQQCNNGH